MTAKPDVRAVSCRLYFLPVRNRVPLCFGRETVTGVICARAAVETEDSRGRRTVGWGETPLNVSWLWPDAELSHSRREQALMDFCRRAGQALAVFPERGHAMELGHLFITRELPPLAEAFSREEGLPDTLPQLAALACFSPFDIALHDAYARSAGVFVYNTYTADFMNHDLSWYYDGKSGPAFAGEYPADFFCKRTSTLPAWHLVGGGDPLTADDLTGSEPDDGYPVLLADWIRRDGLRCLKVKLAGVSPEADTERLRRVGVIAAANGAEWLCADFNCTVEEPEYVAAVLDRLAAEDPALFARILYLEQPFPRDIERRRMQVGEISARKPLFMDESAHSWQHIRLGHELGWSGAALKTCKTQTGALLSLCWAKRHGMPVMVQDLTNPMLAQIPHVLLAAHAGTLMGVETNAMQFYPQASRPEAAVHPGLYTRRNGCVDLSSLGGCGFGYREEEIARALPENVLR